MKRVMFVDDEQDLLDSLRARMYKRRAEWDMVFVNSASGAFALLEEQHFDLVVSDIRMPGIDGREFLRLLKTHWPETIRIVLSGYAEQAHLLELVNLTHQYVSKPCDAERLANIIERCFRLHEILRHETLRSVVGRISSLPSLPRTFQRLQQELDDPNATSASLADVVSHDPAVTAKILQVANSAFFRLSKPITRIRDAVAYLGFGSVRNLALTAEIFTHWKPEAMAELDVEHLESHALATADACFALAQGTTLADDAWLTGLVHDLGYYVLLQETPEQLTRALALSREQQIRLDAAERQLVGASHAEIGAYLLGLWGLPYPIVEAVACHHAPHLVPQHGFDLLAIVATAHSLLGDHAVPVLHLPCEMKPAIDEAYFNSLAPPYDWQEAKRRVAASIEHITG